MYGYIHGRGTRQGTITKCIKGIEQATSPKAVISHDNNHNHKEAFFSPKRKGPWERRVKKKKPLHSLEEFSLFSSFFFFFFVIMIPISFAFVIYFHGNGERGKRIERGGKKKKKGKKRGGGGGGGKEQEQAVGR